MDWSRLAVQRQVIGRQSDIQSREIGNVLTQRQFAI